MLRERSLAIAGCLSASIAADTDPQRILRGKQNMITKMLRRFVPELILQAAHSTISSDTFPFAGHEAQPLSFGGESTVWAVRSGTTAGVFKPDRKALSYSADRLSAAERVANHAKLREHFGDLVVPTSFCIIKQPFIGGLPAVGRYQAERVAIKADIFDLDQNQLAALSRSDLDQLVAGLENSLAQGELPDITGHNNIVVTPEGRIRILDGDEFFTPSEDSTRWEYGISRLEGLYAQLPQPVRHAVSATV